MNILVTGSAGFIGANLVLRLLGEGFQGESVSIVGLDNMNAYYDPSLKEYRLDLIEKRAMEHPEHRYTFVKGDIADKALVDNLFAQNKFDIVVNLAAQAGVRYSIENPDAYIQSNMIGFYNILEACRHAKELSQSSRAASDTAEKSTRFAVPVPGQSPKEKDLRDLRSSGSRAQSQVHLSYVEMKECRRSQDFVSASEQEYQGVQHLVYASSSSVYGGNKKVPFSTDDRVDNPVSLYAATKKSNELFAHCYSKLYNIPSTGLRFFTVYGPAGRPDMAYFGFTNKLLKGETIQIYNYGNCRRDFTYVDDIVEGIVRVMRKAPEKKTGDDGSPLVQGCTYYAYCLMSNHFHLLIREREEKIDQTLKRIADAYVYYYNRKYQRSGHLFKERFRSEPVDNMNYFTTLLCYIHQNPVKAGIVDDVADYAYSSWREYCGEIFSQARICHVEAVLRKIPFEELKELVYTPLPENVGIIDIDDEPLRHRLSDEQVKELIKIYSHCNNATEFQRLERSIQAVFIHTFREQGASWRQLERLTGLSRGFLTRL